MEYSAFTFSVPDINIGLVSVFTVNIDLVDVTQSHSVHRLSFINHCVYLAFPSVLSYTVLTGSRQSRVLRKELYILDGNNVVHELTMLYLSQKDISSLTPEELLDEYEKVYTEIKKKKSEKNSAKWSF